MEERPLPHSLEAERAVLGGLMLDSMSASDVSEILEPGDFYREAHGKLFALLLEMSERGEPTEMVAVVEKIAGANRAEEMGGLSYVSSLPDNVPSTENIEYYARIVRERAVVRRLLAGLTDVAERARAGTDELEELLDYAESTIFKVTQEKTSSDWLALSKIVDQEFMRIQQLSERSGDITGISTGFIDMDKSLAGLQRTDLIILAARPAMGKTALALNLALNAARVGAGVGVFSLEMSAGQLATRLLCIEGRVDAGKVRTGFLSRDQDWPNLVRAAEELHQLPIFLDDTPGLNITQVRSKARRLKSQCPELGLLVVDYIGLMSGDGRVSRQEQIAQSSRGLKALAKELNICVLGLSQLNRAVEQRNPKIPQIADLRECVSGETRVVLADGRRVPISSLVGEAPMVQAVTPEGRLCIARSDKVWKVGKRPIFRLQLASGRTLRATAQHRLLVDGEWQTVGALACGQRVALSRRLLEPTEVECWPDDHLILLGQMIGDGSYLSGQPMRYTTSSEENSRAVQEAAERSFGVEVKRYVGRRSWHQLLISGNGDRWHPAGVNRWLRELGIFNQRSHQKRIPERCFALSNQQIALLLRHMWAADGAIYVATGERSGHRIFYGTNSPGLAGDVAALLLRLGIVARIRRQTTKEQYRDGWTVDISGREYMCRFLEVVGGFGPRQEPAALLRERLTQKADNTNVDTLPMVFWERVREVMAREGISQRRMAQLRGTAYGGSSHFRFAPSRPVLMDYAEKLKDPVSAARASSDLFWDELISVEPDGEEDVYDLTVPGPASWLADGIVSHNSGAIEQDADIIMFIYRDEYYNKESPRIGEADVIIAKQRNGPTGTVTLHFEGRHTRFDNLAKNVDEGYL